MAPSIQYSYLHPLSELESERLRFGSLRVGLIPGLLFIIAQPFTTLLDSVYRYHDNRFICNSNGEKLNKHKPYRIRPQTT